MGDQSVTLIDDVDALRDDLTLKVCVINLWNHMSFYNKDNIWAIELILLDENGRKIQATVYKKCLYRFKNLLKDGSSFYITRPSVASQKPGSFKLTPQDQKLTFVQDTVVTECAEFSGSKFGFSFVEYQSILSFLHPQDTSVDVIGLVVAVSEMIRDNSDKSKQRLTIHIQDANALQLRVILRGDYAYKMQNYIDNNPPNQHVVVILQFAQITIWRDRPSVNTYFTSSKLFINSEIDEITLFKKVRTKLKTIAEIFEPLESGDSTEFFPGEVNALKGLKLAFKIFVTDFNVSKKINQYGITRVSDNVDIIEQLENKFTDSQTGITHSLDIGLAEFESQDNRTLKDVISGTDDNITPSNVDKNSATSPMKLNNTTPVLKRNLEEVFNKELNENLSSSKTPKVSPDGPGKQLLNAKLEKSG
ncbi:unnamed protein product [Lactuca virosa]|uniref:Replication protein A 70 kDa DNA-binding subunit B/D first OB fold domain-containing protein n=1 Tax=Lactuca virosa TaxID=75947 RepID=A0AAU9PEA9_9ASTR|nr:unnamed protein product [Lactuca virosa]